MKGYLVIAGGNIKSNTIYEKFIELAGGPDAKIAVVPTASEDPPEVLSRLSDKFVECGINRKNIVGIQVNSDRESNNEWKKCGDEFESLDFLNDVSGIWFSGGDQIRIIRGLVNNDRTDTKLLKRIREILGNGGTIGGSSAGAAIMSQVMIGGGTSFGALSRPHYFDYIGYRKNPQLEDKGILLIMNGLGFFKEGIVDQHFDRRSRQGRLIEALFDKGITKGYGISEDTALIYDIEKGLISTAGSGGVTVVDISEASRSKLKNYSKITDIKLSYLMGEDSYDIRNNEYYINAENEIKDNEYYAYMRYISSILLAAPASFTNSLEYILRDTKKEMLFYSEEKKMHYIMNYQSGDGDIGYEIRLYKKDGYTRGFIKRDYSFVNIIMDLLPVVFKEDELKEAAE